MGVRVYSRGVSTNEPQRRTLYDRFLRKRPQQARSESVVDAILFAGIEILLRSSDEEGVAVRDVAERAGVGIASVYDYFRDRDNLLASLSARLVDHNRVKFDKVLRETANLSLHDAISLLADETFKTYLDAPRAQRVALQIAHRVGLMPAMASSQNAFAASLARALSERNDVADRDVDAMAYIAIHAVMGVVHTLVWDDTPPIERDRVKAELVVAIERQLSR